MTPKRYSLHGWTVDSLTELAAPAGKGQPDLIIRPMTQPTPAGQLVLHRDVPGAEAWAWRDGDRLTVRVGGRWWFVSDRAARTLHWWFEPGSEPLGEIVLEGLGLAIALEHAAHVVLHASAVVVGEAAVGLVGPSGRGKSTTAGPLATAGAVLLADDLLRLDPPCLGQPLWTAPNGSPRLRLRPNAAGLAPLLPPGTLTATADDRLSWQAPPAAPSRHPVAALLLPRPAQTATTASVLRCSHLQACQVLASGLRVAGHLDPAHRAATFEAITAMAETIPIGVLRVPWGRCWTPALAEEAMYAVRSFLEQL